MYTNNPCKRFVKMTVFPLSLKRQGHMNCNRFEQLPTNTIQQQWHSSPRHYVIVLISWQMSGPSLVVTFCASRRQLKVQTVAIPRMTLGANAVPSRARQEYIKSASLKIQGVFNWLRLVVQQSTTIQSLLKEASRCLHLNWTSRVLTRRLNIKYASTK